MAEDYPTGGTRIVPNPDFPDNEHGLLTCTDCGWSWLYWSDIYKECQTCAERIIGCESCSNGYENYCLKCQGGYTLRDGRCKDCNDIDPDCKNCSGNNCTECDHGYTEFVYTDYCMYNPIDWF